MQPPAHVQPHAAIPVKRQRRAGSNEACLHVCVQGMWRAYMSVSKACGVLICLCARRAVCIHVFGIVTWGSLAAGMYVVTMTLTTVGYGDISAENTSERIGLMPRKRARARALSCRGL